MRPFHKQPDRALLAPQAFYHQKDGSLKREVTLNKTEGKQAFIRVLCGLRKRCCRRPGLRRLFTVILHESCAAGGDPQGGFFPHERGEMSREGVTTQRWQRRHFTIPWRYTV